MFEKIKTYINNKMLKSMTENIALQTYHSDYIQQKRPEWDDERPRHRLWKIDDDTGEIIYLDDPVCYKNEKVEIKAKSIEVVSETQTEEYQNKLREQEILRKTQWLEKQLEQNNIDAVYKKYCGQGTKVKL